MWNKVRTWIRGADRTRPASPRGPVVPAGIAAPEDVLAHLTPGQCLDDDIQLISKLDEAGMAIVWKAQNLRTKEPCVLKFPKEQTPSYYIRLNEEYKNCHKLDHPSIIRVHGLRQVTEGVFCLEEEFVDGTDFGQLLERTASGMFLWHEVKPQIIELLDALAHAHSQDVLHRDLKPRNLMHCVSGAARSRIKVIDFGISAPMAMPHSPTHINASTASLPYASPEQIAGQAPHPADDTYGFGATLYHLLTGVTPFSGLPGDLRNLVQRVSPPDPNKRLEEAGVTARIPPEVVEVIRICLRKKRDGKDARPTDVSVLARKLSSAASPTVVIGGARWRSRSEKMRVARSPLIMIECLRLSLELDLFCGRAGLQIDSYNLQWGPEVLDKVARGEIDLAVYNRGEVTRYLAERDSRDLEICGPAARSMGGNCFYLLGHRDTYPAACSASELRQRRNLVVFVNGMQEHAEAVRLVLPDARIESIDNDLVFSAPSVYKEALFYCGQNLRLVSRQRRDDLVEVLRTADLESDLRESLGRLSENCVVVNRRFRQFVDEQFAGKGLSLGAALAEAQQRFRKRCAAKRERDTMARQIAQLLAVGDATTRELTEAVEVALHATFL